MIGNLIRNIDRLVHSTDWPSLKRKKAARVNQLYLAAHEHFLLKQYELAENHIEASLAQCPDDTNLHVLFAMCANDSGRFDAALTRWQYIRQRWPDLPIAWCGVGANLRESGRSSEAWIIMDDALCRFPNEAIVLLEAGRVADELHLFDEGVGISRRLIAAQPKDVRWRQDYLERLLRQDRLEEASNELDQALALHPEIAALHVMGGVIALKRGAYNEALTKWRMADSRDRPDPVADEWSIQLRVALKRAAQAHQFTEPENSRVIWDYLLRNHPDDADCLDGHLDALIRTGRLDESDAALARALAASPDHRGLRMSEAMLATKRGRWSDAIALLNAILARYPQDAAAREALARATMEAEFARGEALAKEPIIQPQEVGLVRDDAIRSLLLRFESLGRDCEFGLVQRRYGAEPLGLFRWNTVSVDTLIDALSIELHGLGDPVNTILSLWGDKEYYVTDTRWHFGLHTFTTKHEMAEDVIFRKMCTRVTYLRGKFLDDLRQATKTFVLKQDTLNLTTLQRLHNALKEFGPIRLLCVQPLSAARGSIQGEVCTEQAYRAADGLQIGFVPKLGNGIGRWDIHFDDWVAICRSSLASELPPLPS